MKAPSRIAFEEATLRIPGVHCLGQYHYVAAEPGLPLHRHKGCVEISLLAKGCQVYRVGGKTYYVRGGEQYVAPIDESHDTGSEPEEKGILYWLILDVVNYRDNFLFLNREMSRKLVDDLSHLSAHHFPAMPESQAILDKAFSSLQAIRTPDERTGLFQDWSAVSAGKKADDSLALLETASHLITYVLQTLQASRENVRQVSPAIRNSIEFMAKHQNDWLDVAAVANHVHLSESHFKIRFREEVGLPPAEYMLRHKVDAAKELLSRPDRHITDVAYALGFSSSQYFATVFRRYTKLTPSEYLHGQRPALRSIIEAPEPHRLLQPR